MQRSTAPNPRPIVDTQGQVVPWSWNTNKPKKIRFDTQVSIIQLPAQKTGPSIASEESSASGSRE